MADTIKLTAKPTEKKGQNPKFPKFLKAVALYCMMLACLFAGLHLVQVVYDSVLKHSQQEPIQNASLITVFWIGVAAGGALMGSACAVGIVAYRYLFRGKATKGIGSCKEN